MTKPLIYHLPPRTDGMPSHLVGEDVDITVQGVDGSVPSRVIRIENGKPVVCTDFFDRLCPDCEETNCLYNPNVRRERL